MNSAENVSEREVKGKESCLPEREGEAMLMLMLHWAYFSVPPD